MYPYYHKAQEGPTLSASQQNPPNQQNTTSQRAMTSKPDTKLLEMLLMAIQDEIQAQADYTAIADSAATENAALIWPIVADEAKHEQYLKEIYRQLTGLEPPAMTAQPSKLTYNKTTLYNRVLGELEDARGYRQLYLSFLNREFRDLFLELFTDEMIHAQTMNLLYSQQ